MAKKKSRWNPEQIISNDKVLRLDSGSTVLKYDDLKRMIVEAYTLGFNHASEDAKNPTPQYSVQKMYSDRYARMRDLVAYDLSQPLDVEYGHVRILQGDLLDRFLDKK